MADEAMVPQWKKVRKVHLTASYREKDWGAGAAFSIYNGLCGAVVWNAPGENQPHVKVTNDPAHVTCRRCLALLLPKFSIKVQRYPCTGEDNGG